MNNDCDCKDDIKEMKQSIKSHHERLVDLENFQKKIEPIIDNLKVIINDNKWFKILGGGIIGILVYIYAFQLYPFINEVQENKLISATEIKDLEIRLNTNLNDMKQDLIQTLEKKIEKSSKINYRATTKKIIDKMEK